MYIQNLHLCVCYLNIVIFILLLSYCYCLCVLFTYWQGVMEQQEIAFLSASFAVVCNVAQVQHLCWYKGSKEVDFYGQKVTLSKGKPTFDHIFVFNIKLKNHINLYNARKPKTHHIMCVRFTKILLKLRVATKLVPLAGSIRKRNLLLHCWIISSKGRRPN